MSATRKFIQKKRDEAQRLVEACDVLLRDFPSNGESNGKKEENTTAIGAVVLSVLEGSKVPMTTGEMVAALRKSHPHLDGKTLNQRVSATFKYMLDRGNVKRRKKEGKFHYTAA